MTINDDKQKKNAVDLLRETSPTGARILSLVAAHKEMIVKEIKPLGLYLGQEMVLLSLAENQPCSQNELASYLCIDHSTVTTSLSRMEKNGLVTRKKSDQDKRVTLVELTSSGLDTAEKVKDILGKSEVTMTEGLSNDDLQTFCRVASAIVNNLN